MDDRIQLNSRRLAELSSSGSWVNETVIGHLDHWAQATPNAVAVAAYSIDRETRKELKYGELGVMSHQVARNLRDLGVASGDVVAIQLPNWWEALPLITGAVRSGAIVNPIPPFFGKRELSMILKQVQPSLLIVPNEFRGIDHYEMARSIQAEVPSIKQIVTVGSDSGRHNSCDEWLAGYNPDGSGSQKAPVLEPNQPTLLMFTSGTNGAPKGVVHTHNTLARCWSAFRDVLAIGQSDIPLVASTIGHQTGFLVGTQMGLYLGQKMVYLDVWNPERALEIIESEGVTWMHASTTFLRGMLESSPIQLDRLSTFKTFAAGGMAIPPEIVSEARERLGVRTISLWGMTENGATTMVPRDAPSSRSAQSDGRACPGSELRIVNPETKAELPAGQEGLLLTRGPSHFVGYWRRPDLFAAAVDDDGWLDTGDLARVDESGYLRIVGRSKDLVIRGGENIPVLDLENILRQHPMVRDVAVIGLPDHLLGQRACACIVSGSGSDMTLDEMRAFLQGQGVTKQYWPEKVVILGDLPRTAVGKVKKQQLREMMQ